MSNGRGRNAKPPFIRCSTGDPYLDLCAAMVRLAITDLTDPEHSQSARAFLSSSPIAQLVIGLIEAEGHSFQKLAAIQKIRH